ncbi:MAG: hypothetical protein Q8R92_04660, partial [Deltaproteobacteria bacterium]|nr:hypothetical protein [Deltaproteobacteria bacterium]
PTPWWEDASIPAAPDRAEASGDIEAPGPVPTFAEPEAAEPEAAEPEAAEPDTAEPDTADSIVYHEAVPDSIPLLDLPSDSDSPEDELTLDLEPVGPGASGPADTFAEALVETAPNLTEADSIWEEQSGPEVDTEPPDFGPAEVMSDNMLDNMEADPSGVVLLEDELPEIEADDEVTVEEGAAGEFAHDAVWSLDDADLTGGVRAGDVGFEMDLDHEPADMGLADAALGPLSQLLDELDIATSSLAPEAREAVPLEPHELAPEPPEVAIVRPRELPDETVPLDGRVEELADQYVSLGYPDRARALLRSLLEGNPANLSAKRKLREMGSAGRDVARAPSAGDQSVRRKVEENIDVLNRWLANIRKGAAR